MCNKQEEMPKTFVGSLLHNVREQIVESHLFHVNDKMSVNTN